jgi:hypothetical protein
MYYTPETLSNYVFEDLRKPKTPNKNTNCHTTPDSSIPVDTDYSNRFELCVEGYTLPTSPISAISPS